MKKFVLVKQTGLLGPSDTKPIFIVVRKNYFLIPLDEQIPLDLEPIKILLLTEQQEKQINNFLTKINQFPFELYSKLFEISHKIETFLFKDKEQSEELLKVKDLKKKILKKIIEKIEKGGFKRKEEDNIITLLPEKSGVYILINKRDNNYLRIIRPKTKKVIEESLVYLIDEGELERIKPYIEQYKKLMEMENMIRIELNCKKRQKEYNLLKTELENLANKYEDLNINLLPNIVVVQRKDSYVLKEINNLLDLRNKQNNSNREML